MRVGRGALLVLALCGSASAYVVPVTNFSFEEPAFNPGGFNSNGANGWTLVSSPTSWGAFHPTVATWGYTASHLNQVLYINNGTVEQTVSETVTTGHTYTLMVDIVRRPGFGTDVYTVELLAGDTVIAFDFSSLQPEPGEFATTTLTYTSVAGDGLAGENLTIRLGGGNQVNFDHVRLSVEIPSTGSLAVLGLGGLVATRRRR